MLYTLSIKNYAIIDSLEINFDEGLTIITGETGAGKSILTGALSLALGQRADHQVLFDKEKKCIVEGVFSDLQPEITALLKAADLDAGTQAIIRREITPQGKSRAFVNDTPVNLAFLQKLSSSLVNLHAQHEVLELFTDRFQMDSLDAIAGNEQMTAALRKEYQQVAALRRELETLKTRHETDARERDYLTYQLDELERTGLAKGETERLEEEFNILSHAGELKAIITECLAGLSEGENPALDKIERSHSLLVKLAAFLPASGELPRRLDSLAIELKDIASDLAKLDGSIHPDEERFETVKSRLDLVYGLMKKHGAATGDGLVEMTEVMRGRLSSFASQGERMEELEITLKESHARALTSALKLSERRLRAAPRFEKEVNGMLREVEMPHARLKITVQPFPETLSEHGIDAVDFSFSANKGGSFLPLKKVASGGELSRLMLCVRSLLGKHKKMPTMIFDEIDTGISGETARRVGDLIAGLSGGHQVMCITHRPQIAGKGNSHLHVYKETEGGRTFTRVKMLDKQERIIEIAQMLSGENPSEAALGNARELLGIGSGR